MKRLRCLAIILGVFLLTRVCGAEVTDVIKEIPFEDVTLDGLLKDRAELAFRQLQENYFPSGKSQPTANAAAARKAPNLAETAQVFRRDRPTEQLLGEVGKLFGVLKQDRTLAICAFVWSGPQKVRQVALQWPEAGAMPKPEAIVLRWSDTGELHTAAQPGIIGNGRQWVYTLGKAQEGAVVDGLVLRGKDSEEIPETLAVPDDEILAKP